MWLPVRLAPHKTLWMAFSSAFSAANGVVLGQAKTEEKSIRITATPESFKLPNLHGCLVTTDAMGR